MKVLWAIVLCSVGLSCTAQKRDRVWCFGTQAGIDFSDTVNPVPIYTACHNQQGAASICDTDGRLLFYFADDSLFVPNTGSIKNGQNQTIANGDSMKCYSQYTNGGMFIPMSDSYYLFSISSDSQAATYQSLYYSLIKHTDATDIVIEKNVPLLDIPLEWKIAATKQANGVDWWVIVHRAQPNFLGGPYDPLGCNNTYYTYSVTDSGVAFRDSQFVGTPRCSTLGVYGEMTFSRSGKFLTSTVAAKSAIELCSFDRCTGMIENVTDILNVGDSTKYTYGVEFSPDEKKLYVVTADDGSLYGELWQYDLSAADISTSKVLLGRYRIDTLKAGELQLGPDGKIYMANYVYVPSDKVNYIGVINNPNAAGLSCGFDVYGFDLGVRNGYSLPNNPNYDLGTLSTIWQTTAGKDTSVCACQDSIPRGVVIGGDSVAGVTTTWEVAGGIANVHQLYQVVYPTSSTWYRCTFSDTTITGSCQSREDSVYVEVKTCVGIQEMENNQHLTIYPNPSQNTVTITWPQQNQAPATITLIDILGREAYKEQPTSSGPATIDISALQAGVYIVKFSAGDRLLMGKVVKR